MNNSDASQANTTIVAQHLLAMDRQFLIANMFTIYE
uniref:Uncharacterized protein n=1 Tax=Anopheles albimanus TaxID=7167 RepID=A0A182FZG3_ANOAL